MYRSSPARAYGPPALIAAVQLIVVPVGPTAAPTVGADTLAAGGLAGAPPGIVLAKVRAAAPRRLR